MSTIIHSGYILTTPTNNNADANSFGGGCCRRFNADSGSTTTTSSSQQQQLQPIPSALPLVSSAVLPIVGGGGVDRKMSDDTSSSIGSFENMSRPVYQGRDTDRFFGGGEFEFDDDDEDEEEYGGYHRHAGGDFGYPLDLEDDDDDDDDDGKDDEPISELVPLGVGGGTRRVVPRTPRRKSTSKCGFYDFYKLTDEHLGAGAYGKVTTCQQLSTGHEYAVKIVDKHGEKTHSRQRIMRQVNIFKTCKNHPNIVQLVDWFEDDESFYLVMEKMRGGPLLQHILQKGYFTEEEARKVTKEVATALKFMHDRGIAHRDVKPENVLCTDPQYVSPVKLCDLDLASQRHPHKQEKLVQVASEPDLASPVGSAEFMAPEVVDAFVGDALKYDKKCDTWSLGVILYIMLAGYAPFQGECDDENCGWQDGQPCDECQQVLFDRIQSGKYAFPEEDWSMISDEARDLVENLLKRDPTARYSADQILSHAWILESAPPTILQTPSNLIYRKDSARDVQQMSEHFNVMSRYVAARLSARMDQMSLVEEPTTATTIFGATMPISRASPTTPPMSLIDSSEKRNDSGCYSIFSPTQKIAQRDSIQLFGSGTTTGPIVVNNKIQPTSSIHHHVAAEV